MRSPAIIPFCSDSALIVEISLLLCQSLYMAMDCDSVSTTSLPSTSVIYREECAGCSDRGGEIADIAPSCSSYGGTQASATAV